MSWELELLRNSKVVRKSWFSKLVQQWSLIELYIHMTTRRLKPFYKIVTYTKGSFTDPKPSLQKSLIIETYGEISPELHNYLHCSSGVGSSHIWVTKTNCNHGIYGLCQTILWGYWAPWLEWHHPLFIIPRTVSSITEKTILLGYILASFDIVSLFTRVANCWPGYLYVTTTVGGWSLATI